MLGGHGDGCTLLGDNNLANGAETGTAHLLTTSAGDSLNVLAQLAIGGNLTDGADEREVALLLLHLDGADLLGNGFLASLEIVDGTLHAFHIILQGFNLGGVVHLGLLNFFVFLVFFHV